MRSGHMSKLNIILFRVFDYNNVFDVDIGDSLAIIITNIWTGHDYFIMIWILVIVGHNHYQYMDWS